MEDAMDAHPTVDRTGIPRIEAYESGIETVIFDGKNPLAWIASSSAVPLEQRA